jgi:hypothetical protein
MARYTTHGRLYRANIPHDSVNTKRISPKNGGRKKKKTSLTLPVASDNLADDHYRLPKKCLGTLLNKIW